MQKLEKRGLMARHKQGPGRTFQLIPYGDNLLVKCTYRCPYCLQDATSNYIAGKKEYKTLNEGLFYLTLQCDLCNERANIRFLPCNRF